MASLASCSDRTQPVEVLEANVAFRQRCEHLGTVLFGGGCSVPGDEVTEKHTTVCGRGGVFDPETKKLENPLLPVDSAENRRD